MGCPPFSSCSRCWSWAKSPGSCFRNVGIQGVIVYGQSSSFRFRDWPGSSGRVWSSRSVSMSSSSSIGTLPMSVPGRVILSTGVARGMCPAHLCSSRACWAALKGLMGTVPVAGGRGSCTLANSFALAFSQFLLFSSSSRTSSHLFSFLLATSTPIKQIWLCLVLAFCEVYPLVEGTSISFSLPFEFSFIIPIIYDTLMSFW